MILHPGWSAGRRALLSRPMKFDVIDTAALSRVFRVTLVADLGGEGERGPS
jgi:hypothetical protein